MKKKIQLNYGKKWVMLKYNLDIQIFVILPWKELKSVVEKKTKDITEKEEAKYKAFFESQTGILIIEKLTRDIIERCKLPEAIELKKKLGYYHDDIMIREETSIAEKIIKLFPKEKLLLLMKNLIAENQIIGLKIIILLLKLMKEIMKIMIHMTKKKEKIC